MNGGDGSRASPPRSTRIRLFADPYHKHSNLQALVDGKATDTRYTCEQGLSQRQLQAALNAAGSSAVVPRAASTTGVAGGADGATGAGAAGASSDGDGCGNGSDDSAWVAIDLGELYTNITHIRISWEMAYPEDFKVLVSANGREFTSVHEAIGKATIKPTVIGTDGGSGGSGSGGDGGSGSGSGRGGGQDDGSSEHGGNTR